LSAANLKTIHSYNVSIKIYTLTESFNYFLIKLNYY